VFSAVGGYVFLTNQYAPSNIAIVMLEPGRGDMSMVDQVVEGLEELQGDVTVNYEYFEALNEDDAQDIMENLATQGVYDLIIVIGQELTQKVQAVASTHTNQKFALIGGTVIADNVVSATFAQHEAAFLAGSLAAFIATQNVNTSRIVGILGSVSTDPTIISLIAGFTQGLEYANTTYALNVTLLPAEYVNSYNDSDTASSLAYDMFEPNGGNATVIFAPVRASIACVREAMELANSTHYVNITGREPFVIAAEGNQDYLGLPDPDIRSGDRSWVVTSVVPRSDLAVYTAINSTLWGEFEGGVLPTYNLFNGGVNITSFEFSEHWVTSAIQSDLQDIRFSIMNGTIIVDDGLP
jgi:basic membrane protein A